MPPCSCGRQHCDDQLLFGCRSGFKLTDLICRQAGPGRHADGNCLYLHVRDSGSRSWTLRLTIVGHRCDLGLGSYPGVSLACARRTAAEYRGIARRGGDPRAQRASNSVPTVREAAERVIADLRRNWTAADAERRYRADLEQRIFPAIGGTPVDRVTVTECYAIVHPIWEGRGSRGYRARHQLFHLMRWAVAHEYRIDNPAEQVLNRLPKVQSRLQNQPSLPHGKVRVALARLRSAPVPEVAKLALTFIVLTAVRLREATEAPWSEFDFDGDDAPLWTIPGSRMKKRKEHRVPLSEQVVGTLDEARALDPSGDLVFGVRNGRQPPRPLRSAEMSKVLRQLGLKDAEGRAAVVHGFRSTFADWVADHAPDSSEASEAALAHYPASTTRKRYQRNDMLTARRPLMQKWADYVLPRS